MLFFKHLNSHNSPVFIHRRLNIENIEKDQKIEPQKTLGKKIVY